jgi:hypothetical protein
MRISHTGPKQLSVDGAGQAEKSPPIQTGDEVVPKRVSVEAGGYSPSAEIVHLTTLATQVPDVRPDVIRQVAFRLSQGNYSTSASAQQTAQALLRALD